MVKDVRAAVKALTAEKLKVGVVGYCLGGTLAWLAATRIDGVACAVGYYGGGIADTASETPHCPVLLHFGDRKSTRLNSSHGYISYAVFCLKKKKKYNNTSSTAYIYPPALL